MTKISRLILQDLLLPLLVSGILNHVLFIMFYKILNLILSNDGKPFEVYFLASAIINTIFQNKKQVTSFLDINLSSA